MMDYYQRIITDRSFLSLQSLKKNYRFVLIGGWAVYLYTNTLKSKDIDIVIDYEELNKFRRDFAVSKNERLKKYEIKLEEIDIDIYLPHYSKLGIPAEVILKRCRFVNGFYLPEKEILLITKQKAYESRKSSIKGQKDLIDIISLITLEDFDFKSYKDTITKNKIIELKNDLIRLIKETKEIPELGFNQHVFAKKKKILLDVI